MVLRNNEITTLEQKGVMTVTESPITMAGSSLAVTVSAEADTQHLVPVTGLSMPSGV